MSYTCIESIESKINHILFKRSLTHFTPVLHHVLSWSGDMLIDLRILVFYCIYFIGIYIYIYITGIYCIYLFIHIHYCLTALEYNIHIFLQISVRQTPTSDIQLVTTLCGDERPNDMMFNASQVVIQTFQSIAPVTMQFNISYYVIYPHSAG